MQNEMRDRLIELIDIEYDGEPNCLLCEEASDKCQKCEHRWEYKLADHLIENGVIVLPIKIGDKFYTKYGYSATVESIRLFPDGDIVFCGGNKGTSDYIPFHSKEIGKYVFLTREEAEQKLKGGVDNG